LIRILFLVLSSDPFSVLFFSLFLKVDSNATAKNLLQNQI